MNLHHNPTLSTLSSLVGKCNDFQNYHDIVVMQNGEVMIQLSNESAEANEAGYKFCFRQFLRGKHAVGFVAAENTRYINHIYKYLVFCWKNDMQGIFDRDEIFRLKNYRVSPVRFPITGIQIKSETQPGITTAF